MYWMTIFFADIANDKQHSIKHLPFVLFVTQMHDLDNKDVSSIGQAEIHNFCLSIFMS